MPPPHHFKIETLAAYAAWSKARVFVETGTFQAETTLAMAPHFPRIYSIELEPTLAALARRTLAGHPHVKVIFGDSGLVLPQILSEISERTLFWLDGHNCGPATGMSAHFGPTPVAAELNCIFNHPVRDHVILIDDQRYFTGEWGYPTIDELIRYVRSTRPDLIVDVCMDSIRIHPERMT